MSSKLGHEKIFYLTTKVDVVSRDCYKFCLGFGSGADFSCATVITGMSTSVVGDYCLRVIVEDWGPRDAVLGVGANCQPDGASAIWIRLFASKGLRVDRVRFGEYLWRPANLDGAEVVTAIIPPCIIQRVGCYPVYIIGANGETIQVGQFCVRPA